jgi:putative ABC transport system permease protein
MVFFKPSMSIPILIIVFLLPIACMVNLFISMVGERTEELGIRKSFGATAGNITGQFIVESIMMTFVAGIFALGLSIPFWKIFLAVDYDTVTRDIFSWRVFAISILGFTVIGAVVGYFTSIKLAKTSIVRSLGTAQS